MKKNRVPSGLSEPERDAGTARERTVAHMENLLRTATTVGAGIVLACGARAQGQRPPQPCDPMPPPVRCCEDPDQFLLRWCLDHQTRWVKSGEGWTLELSLWVHARGGQDRISFAELKREEIKVSGASVKEMKKGPQKLGFVLAPVVGEKQVNMELAVQCNEKRIPLKLALDLSKPPAENRSVPVKQVK